MNVTHRRKEIISIRIVSWRTIANEFAQKFCMDFFEDFSANRNVPVN